MTDTFVSPLKGRWPVAILYRTTPSENTSDRASMDRPSACSGDMYAAVPRISSLPGGGKIRGSSPASPPPRQAALP